MFKINNAQFVAQIKSHSEGLWFSHLLHWNFRFLSTQKIMKMWKKAFKNTQIQKNQVSSSWNHLISTFVDSFQPLIFEFWAPVWKQINWIQAFQVSPNSSFRVSPKSSISKISIEFWVLKLIELLGFEHRVEA